MSSKPPPQDPGPQPGVHGRGLRRSPIEAGHKIIEYTGERISWQKRRTVTRTIRPTPTTPSTSSLDSGEVIDALYGGNNARWINHSCEPNCEAEETDAGRVFIRALRDIEPGEELFYDYGLVLDERYTAKLKKEFACFCGTATCRGTCWRPSADRTCPSPSLRDAGSLSASRPTPWASNTCARAAAAAAGGRPPDQWPGPPGPQLNLHPRRLAHLLLRAGPAGTA